jgi:hypothetical protein
MVRDSSLATHGAPRTLTPTAPQVLFKRKPVQFLPVPEIDDDHQEVRAPWLARPNCGQLIDPNWILTTLRDIGLAYPPDGRGLSHLRGLPK